MWTKQKDVIKFSNEYLKDVTIEEIKIFARLLKMELTKEEISTWLLNVAKANGVDMVVDREALATKRLSELDENMLRRIANEFVAEEERKKYQLNEKDYDMFARALKIYQEKCLKLCIILELIESKQISYAIIEDLDLTLKDDEILTSDLIRILKPLKKNYELAFQMNIRANNYATYLGTINTPITGKIRISIPNSSIMNKSNIYSDEAIEMTEKQRLERKQKLDEIKRRLT